MKHLEKNKKNKILFVFFFFMLNNIVNMLNINIININKIEIKILIFYLEFVLIIWIFYDYYLTLKILIYLKIVKKH